MSLATRCNSCGTVFRVVQDQLKVSEGWVRCGRCDAVFNALEGLFDLGREPPLATDGRAEAVSGNEGFAAPTVREPAEDRERDEDEDEDDDKGPLTAPLELGEPLDPIDAHLFRKRGAEVDRASVVQVNERDRLEFSDARFDSDLFAEGPSAIDPTLIDSPTTSSADLPLESTTQQPDFLRRAERRARWRSRPARLALMALCAAAALGLALQVVHHARDTVAVRWPATQPVLVAWCKAVGCSIDAPRNIDDVSVEHTDLTRAAGVDAFILSVTLRSHSAAVLALPSIDLTLTDGNGRLVARRALAPRDFGASALLQPGGETALQLMLGAGGARIAGYTVEIFYP